MKHLNEFKLNESITYKSRSGKEYELKEVNIEIEGYGKSIGFIAILLESGRPAWNNNGPWVFPTETVAKIWIEEKWR